MILPIFLYLVSCFFDTISGLYVLFLLNQGFSMPPRSCKILVASLLAAFQVFGTALTAHAEAKNPKTANCFKAAESYHLAVEKTGREPPDYAQLAERFACGCQMRPERTINEIKIAFERLQTLGPAKTTVQPSPVIKPLSRKEAETLAGIEANNPILRVYLQTLRQGNVDPATIISAERAALAHAKKHQNVADISRCFHAEQTYLQTLQTQPHHSDISAIAENLSCGCIKDPMKTIEIIKALSQAQHQKKSTPTPAKGASKAQHLP